MNRLAAIVLILSWLTLPRAATAQETASTPLGLPSREGPTVVRVGFFLTDVNTIDEENQRFEVEGILSLTWQDPRRVFDPELEGARERVFQGTFQVAEVATGWWPQVILANESGGHERQGMVLRQRFDGWMTYTEEMNAFAEMPIELRRFPFDREHFELVFEVLGFGADQVILQHDSSTTGTPEEGISLSEWKLEALRVESRQLTRRFVDGGEGTQSSVVATLDLARNAGFMLRVVVLPMMLLVALSWSVFWMDRESLGNRMDISFIGVLTVVAYQILVGSTIPRIPYFTLMSAFIYASLLTVAASVLVNLAVDHLDRTGRREMGNRVDEACRWAFPAAYGSLLLLAVVYFFVRY